MVTAADAATVSTDALDAPPSVPPAVQPARPSAPTAPRARTESARGARARVTAMTASCCGIAAMGVFSGEVRPVYGRRAITRQYLDAVNADTSEASNGSSPAALLPRRLRDGHPARRGRRGPRRPAFAEPADPATRTGSRLRPLRSLRPRTLAHRRRPGVPPRRRGPPHARDPGERHRPLDRARDGVGSHGGRRADHRGRRDLPLHRARRRRGGHRQCDRGDARARLQRDRARRR